MPWLFLAYPLLAHVAALLHSQALAAAALVVFVAVPLLPALTRGSVVAWLSLVAVAALLTVLARGGWASYVTYLPPILIPLSVLWVFARSLRPQQEPIVSEIAARIRGAALPPELMIYTRHVTQCWVVLLACLALGSLLLALFASRELWSLMTNIVMYLVLASVFVVEYAWRRWRFRHLQHESFATMVQGLFKGRVG
jgi:uncharacterized membrane protein